MANPIPEVDINDRNGMEEDEYYVETVVRKSLVAHEVLYHVKWIGYDESENTDEDLGNLLNSLETVKEYEKNEIEKLRQADSSYHLDNLDKGEPAERWERYALQMKKELMEQAAKGAISILRIFGMTFFKNKKHYLVEWNNKKVLPIVMDEVAKFPVAEQRKFIDFEEEIKPKAIAILKESFRHENRDATMDVVD